MFDRYCQKSCHARLLYQEMLLLCLTLARAELLAGTYSGMFLLDLRLNWTADGSGHDLGGSHICNFGLDQTEKS